MIVRASTRTFRLAALALILLALAPWAAAQDDPIDEAAAGLGPLASGVMVTEELETSDLLVHLGLIGWGFEYQADTPFSSVTVAVVSMERPHLDAPFTRTPLGGALTVSRPEPAERADLAVLLDALGDEPRLTLRVGNDTSLAVVDPPALLGAPAGTVRRPYVSGLVVPTDPEGRYILVEAYPDAEDGMVSTGDVADMTAYLAVEVRVE
jgi:hypothetical protein